ncbi:MAG: NUDIX domain-containing protein [Ignavibacteriae bacterium]|nr:NUDIX domain-containing protein [Ignavibacteriota bacterium]
MKTKTNLIEAHIIKKTKKGIEYLIMKRALNQKYPNIWQMVTGKIHQDEKAYQTAIREIKEETNLYVDELYTVPNVNSFYDDTDDSITIIPVFVAVVKKEQDVKLSDEHSEYKWVFADEAKKLFAWVGQRQSVDIIEEYFTHQSKELKIY